jgi:16S rRNA (adenine1518-N6/adenine1519-N6)-dimethyltransferase
VLRVAFYVLRFTFYVRPDSSPRALLEKYGIRPSKGLGQHFLADPVALDRIVAAAGLTPADIVLEIGPGLGTLTRRLAAQAGHVVAVELDRRMVEILGQELADCPNVEIVQGDILAVSLSELLGADRQPPTADRQLPAAVGGHPSVVSPRFKVVANLPYYITSAVLRHVLEAPVRPSLAVLTVQREVAQRLVARPGDLSLLAVSVQFYGQPEVVARIPAGAFYPPPQVDSAVVRIRVFDRPPVEVDDVDRFFQVVRAGFGQKRKQLRNALAAGLHRPPEDVAARLTGAGIDPRRRAETLSLAEWAAVYTAMTR